MSDTVTTADVNGRRYIGGNKPGFRHVTTAGVGSLIKSNLTAVVAPTPNDDSSLGYSLGSIWIDTVLFAVYTCVDATVGLAAWTAGGGGGGGALPAGIGNELQYRVNGITFGAIATSDWDGATVSLPTTHIDTLLTIHGMENHFDAFIAQDITIVLNWLAGFPYDKLQQIDGNITYGFVNNTMGDNYYGFESVFIKTRSLDGFTNVAAHDGDSVWENIFLIDDGTNALKSAGYLSVVVDDAAINPDNTKLVFNNGLNDHAGGITFTINGDRSITHSMSTYGAVNYSVDTDGNLLITNSESSAPPGGPDGAVTIITGRSTPGVLLLREGSGTGTNAVGFSAPLVLGASATYTLPAVNVNGILTNTAGILSWGSGLIDGDYGDITVSVGGTVLTIDSDVVTYAKMQNVSATDKLLGRASAGAGDVEEISCTEFGRIYFSVGAEISATIAANATTLALASGVNHLLDFAAFASGTVSITFAGAVIGVKYLLRIKQGATARAITWITAGLKWDTIGEPTWNSDTSKERLVTVYWNGTNYYMAVSDTYV